MEFGDESGFLKSSEEFVSRNRWQVLSALVGLVFVAGGIFLFGSSFFEQPKVEILGAESQGNQGNMGAEIVAEISGEVQKPGVYKLASNSRVDDLLISAGGLSSSADRTYVEKNINRAGKLVDGQKIFIPKIGEVRDIGAVGGETQQKASINSKININSASLKELDSLSGVGAVRAQAIIDNRPYGTIEQLVEKKVLTKSVFDKIKDNIIAQ